MNPAAAFPRLRRAVRSLGLAGCLFAPLPAAAERIVTLGASVTETVFAIGAGDLVVARDASSLFPAAARALPDVGYFRTIGAEGVLALRPTLILAASGTGPDSQVSLLKNSGVPFVHLDAKPSADSTLAMIAAVGRATGCPAEAEALATRLRARFAEAAALSARSPRPPKVAILMGAGALQVSFEGTAAHALIGLAGGVNPFTGHQGYKPAAAEELLAADPDFIFLATRDEDLAGPAFGEPAAAPGWLRATRAAQTGRLRTLNMTYYLVFGPRSGDAVLAFARAIHGGLSP